MGSGEAPDLAGRILCVDVGSTFTKGFLVDLDTGIRGPLAAVPSTIDTDVLDGITHVRAASGADEATPIVACSSAGGGLRLAVVGFEPSVTALAGERVGLSAGARVVHVATGPLDRPGIAALRAARPDVVLLVGGTDGGNAAVLLHNATRLARTRITAPIVLAGNAEAHPEAAAILASTGRSVTVAANVLPRIGVIAPDSARAAIREVFLTHVIGGKHLSRGPRFARMVRRATPDAVLRGVEVLAALTAADVMLIDVGGATTDVYSAVTPQGEDAAIHRDVVAPLRFARTVEADLGMRWSAPGVLEAAGREGLPLPETTIAYAARVRAEIASLPRDASDWAAELDLARVAATVAARRHGRAAGPSQRPRPLREVRLLLGSGGVLRHAPPGGADDVLGAVLRDHAGGWPLPGDADTGVDAGYVLFAVGLLADEHPGAARALAATLVTRT